MDSCVFIGNNAGDSPGTGAQAIAIGDYAGRYATLGDIAIGYAAGGFNGGGSNAGYNASMGYYALYSMGSGAYRNIGIGYKSGYTISSGDHNITIGADAGANISTGDRNICTCICSYSNIMISRTYCIPTFITNTYIPIST
jgi:hypothetical protein